jgi:hypothetical protein
MQLCEAAYTDDTQAMTAAAQCTAVKALSITAMIRYLRAQHHERHV